MIPDIQKLRSGLAAALATALLAACGGGTAPSIDAPAASPPTPVRLVAVAETPAATDPVMQAVKATRTNNAYLVQMADLPVTAYAGGIKGLAATKPAKGQKIDPNSPAVVAYMGYLARQQNAALASVGGGQKLYS